MQRGIRLSKRTVLGLGEEAVHPSSCSASLTPKNSRVELD